MSFRRRHRWTRRILVGLAFGLLVAPAQAKPLPTGPGHDDSAVAAAAQQSADPYLTDIPARPAVVDPTGPDGTVAHHLRRGRDGAARRSRRALHGHRRRGRSRRPTTASSSIGMKDSRSGSARLRSRWPSASRSPSCAGRESPSRQQGARLGEKRAPLRGPLRRPGVQSRRAHAHPAGPRTSGGRSRRPRARRSARAAAAASRCARRCRGSRGSGRTRRLRRRSSVAGRRRSRRIGGLWRLGGRVRTASPRKRRALCGLLGLRLNAASVRLETFLRGRSGRRRRIQWYCERCRLPRSRPAGLPNLDLCGCS